MSDEDDILKHAAGRIGSTLHGKYRLDSILGVGGMAVVYAATHRNQKRFAVKILQPELSIRTEFRKRFLREGYVANAVAHEGVVAVLDDDVDETGAAFLVMELLDGGDVQSQLARAGGRLPLQVALLIAHQVLGVLAAAHERAVVHRDIKPANLFLLTNGQVKVLDFGIARLRGASSDSASTRAGAVLGSPSFMAPEQASGQGEQVDARTDLWALGATLFTLLSGQHVHEAGDGRETLLRAATTSARSLASVAPDLPGSVVALVDKALAFEPAERWQSAAAFREAVAEAHRALFGEPSRAPLQAWLVGSLPAIALRPTSFEFERTDAASAGMPRVAPRRGPRRTLMLLGAAAALLVLGLTLRAESARQSRRAPRALDTSLAAALPAVIAAPRAPLTEPVRASTPPAGVGAADVPRASAVTGGPRRALVAQLTLNRNAPPAPAHVASPTGAPVASSRPRSAPNPLALELQ